MAVNAEIKPQGGSRLTSVDLAMLTVALIWGINASVVKSALDGWNPAAFNAIRFASAALLIFGWVRLTDPHWRLKRRDLRYVALLGLVGNGLYQWLYIESIGRTTASNVSLLIGLSPLVVTLWGALTGRDRVTPWLLGGTAISVMGVSLVIAGGKGSLGFGSATFAGDLIGLGAMFCWAAYTVYARPIINRVGSSLRVTAWTMVFGALTNLVIGVPGLFQQEYSAVNGLSVAGMIYSSLFSLAYGYLVYAWAVKQVGGARTALYVNLTPLIAAAVAGIFLGEHWGLMQWAGAVIVIIGVTVAKLGKN